MCFRRALEQVIKRLLILKVATRGVILLLLMCIGTQHLVLARRGVAAKNLGISEAFLVLDRTQGHLSAFLSTSIVSRLLAGLRIQYFIKQSQSLILDLCDIVDVVPLLRSDTLFAGEYILLLRTGLHALR